MSPRLTLKDPGFEYRLVRRRILTACVLMFIFVAVMLARISWLQVVLHDHFTTLSQNNRVKIIPVPPIRGLIFSRDGVLLADNRPSFSLVLVPEEVHNIHRTIERLRKIVPISDGDIARFNDLLRKKRSFESIPLRFNLSDEEVAMISVNLHRFPGVDVAANLNRYYPLGPMFSHTIGYVGMIDEQDLDNVDRSNYSGTSHIGKIGVERAYEDLLHGRVGYEQVEVNAEGRVIRVLDRTPPIPGKDLYLTIDVSLQNLAEQALDGKRGAVVAIDPRNGGVLALVSSPGYDPNQFVNGIDARAYKDLLESDDTPLLNRALRGKYPPGSTIKPFLGFSALQDGVRTMDDQVWCQGWYTLKGDDHRYRDWKKGGHGHVDLTEAIEQSCDVYFYTLAHDLGIDRIYAALRQFGFGSPTGIDIGGESGGLLPSRAWKRKAMRQPWYPGETVNLGIGQGYLLVTPMQLAAAAAAIANRGHLIKPHLLDDARDPISGKILIRASTSLKNVIHADKDEYWDDIINAMYQVVNGPRGTSRRTGIGAPYKIAGKTGTAQVIGVAQNEEYHVSDVPEDERDHSWFIAFAPVDNPTIAVAIIVENGGADHSAAPIARTLFDHYLINPVADKN